MFECLTNYEHTAAQEAKPVRLINKGQSVPEGFEALAKANGFDGEAGSVLATPSEVLLGVGDNSQPFIAAHIAKLPEGKYRLADELSAQDAVRHCLGFLLGTYRFDRYKEQPSVEASLMAPPELDVEAVKNIARAVHLARDLINTPANDMGPPALEQAVRGVAERTGATVRSIQGQALCAQNFPMIHAVGRASSDEPRLIDMSWGRADAPKVTLVGKGVCFDSGGLNIKGAGGMALMKKDMGGAANVLGLASMLIDAQCDIRLRVLIPAVENAIAGQAFRPGDVLESRKGLRVEIGNTDAEGRLVLADALTLACEEKPDLLISMATLTGAARVALGPELPPFYTNDDTWAAKIERAAAQEHDPVWRMPLWAPYDSMLASPIADLNNISGGAFAGSITAALFLNRFVDDAGAFIHFDIYGWRPKEAPGAPVGGEAQAIRALSAAITRHYTV